jgi:hypothetical protein
MSGLMPLKEGDYLKKLPNRGLAAGGSREGAGGRFF